jgi:hypothetical protein
MIKKENTAERRLKHYILKLNLKRSKLRFQTSQKTPTCFSQGLSHGNGSSRNRSSILLMSFAKVNQVFSFYGCQKVIICQQDQKNYKY